MKGFEVMIGLGFQSMMSARRLMLHLKTTTLP